MVTCVRCKQFHLFKKSVQQNGMPKKDRKKLIFIRITLITSAILIFYVNSDSMNYGNDFPRKKSKINTHITTDAHHVKYCIEMTQLSQKFLIYSIQSANTCSPENCSLIVFPSLCIILFAILLRSG